MGVDQRDIDKKN